MAGFLSDNLKLKIYLPLFALHPLSFPELCHEWARDNKRSYSDDKQRAERIKEFFGPKRAIRDITPMLIEKFKRRLSEILKARWWDIDFVACYISIIQTKTDKPRKIPLTARALEILRGLRQDAAGDERIFDHKRTGRRRRQLMVCFRQAVKNAGIDDFHFHDLRHTFATRLRAANVHEYDIADLLGHSTTKYDTRGTAVTRGYAHGVPVRLRDTVDSLEEGKRIILEGWKQEASRAG